RGDVVRITDRIIINHDREASRAGCCPEVCDRFARVAFVKHGGHEHEAVETELFAVTNVTDRLGGTAFSHAAENGNAAAHGGDHCLDDAALFFGSERLI